MPEQGARISIDGDKWCALLGEDPVVGVAGFGDDPISAIQDLRDRICQTKRLLDKDPFIDWSFQQQRVELSIDLLKARAVEKAIDREEFITLEDGCLFWIPSGGGAIASWHLRAIADYLDVQNNEGRIKNDRC